MILLAGDRPHDVVLLMVLKAGVTGTIVAPLNVG